MVNDWLHAFVGLEGRDSAKMFILLNRANCGNVRAPIQDPRNRNCPVQTAHESWPNGKLAEFTSRELRELPIARFRLSAQCSQAKSEDAILAKFPKQDG